jgi:hypothetical protein
MTCKITGDKTDFSLTDIAGDYNIKTQYGSIVVEPATGFYQLVVDALRTSVKVPTLWLLIFLRPLIKSEKCEGYIFNSIANADLMIPLS